MYNELELYHHGVKGMKWGVRRKRSSYKSNLKRAVELEINTIKLHKNNKKIEKALKINPTKNDKRTVNRYEVLRERAREANAEHNKQFKNELAKHKKKHPEYFDKNGDFYGDGQEAIDLIGEDKYNAMVDKIDRTYREKYRSKFIDATLKDAGVEVTERGKQYVDEYFDWYGGYR